MFTIHRRFTRDRNSIPCQDSASSLAPGPPTGPVSSAPYKSNTLAMVKGMMGLMVEGLSPWAGLKRRRSYDLIIVSSGPAGLAAALCATGEGLKTLIIKVNRVDSQGKVLGCSNWFPPVPQRVKVKAELTQIIGQTDCIGLEVLSGGVVTSVRTEADVRVVTTETGEEYRARSVLLASGVHLWWLETLGNLKSSALASTSVLPALVYRTFDNL